MADSDVWMKDAGTYYEYICVYVDDSLVIQKDPMVTNNLLAKWYKLKGVGAPEYYLGADIKRFKKPEDVLTMGCQTYVKKCVEIVETMIDATLETRYTAPLDPGDHPEVDTTEELGPHGRQQYQSMVGMLQWAVALGRIDITCAVMSLSHFRVAPRKGHFTRVVRIFSFLKRFKNCSIKFRTANPDYSKLDKTDKEFDWRPIYGEVSEDLPPHMPVPKGKPVRTSTFVDANLMHDFVTGRSTTGIIHLLNATPIEWYSKWQNTVESATYGSEFVAARIATEQIMDLRYSLRMMGVPLDGEAWMFGDNLSVIVSSNIPTSSLKKCHNAIAYHRVREAIAAKILKFIHIAGNQNPADVLTKYLPHRLWFPLLKPLLFWITDTGDTEPDQLSASQ
jgi:hypothetical protein